MEKNHYLIQGALCQCKFSEKPQTDELQVKAQSKHFANDLQGKDKPIATDKDIGKTMKKNTFGNCTLQPSSNGNLPCQTVITQWTGFYEKTVLSNGGKILLESSMAGCAIGGPNCIVVKDHGQTPEMAEQMEDSNPEILHEIFPCVDFYDLNNKSLMIEN